MAKMNNNKLQKSPYGGDSGGLLSLLLVLVLALFGCKEEGRIDHIDDSAPAPAQVTNVTVRNTPGGAVLKYTLPADKNLLYIRAEYEIQPGVILEAKSSNYKDSLVLEGFGDERVYDVKLYSVGKNEKASDPLIQQVQPLMAPVHLATKQLRETFGGIAVDIENPERANLAIGLLADLDTMGYMSEVMTFYTSKPKGYFTYRGLDSVPYTFSVYFRDRWNNYSDTITAELTPWYEEFIPKGTWIEYNLPGDMQPVNASYPLRTAFDGITTGSGFHGLETTPLPSVVTWDMGITAKLSRLKFFPRKHVDDRWKRGHPRIFEIWGSNAPNPNGALDDTWIPLGRFESEKPSGPGSQITQEDIDFADAGIDFDFVVSDFAPDPYAPVRYIRFRTISTYANASLSTTHILEISFWGILAK